MIHTISILSYQIISVRLYPLVSLLRRSPVTMSGFVNCSLFFYPAYELDDPEAHLIYLVPLHATAHSWHTPYIDTEQTVPARPHKSSSSIPQSPSPIALQEEVYAELRT